MNTDAEEEVGTLEGWRELLEAFLIGTSVREP